MPQYWTLVFPLGMYTAGTSELAQVFGLQFLLVISYVMLPVVLAVWLLIVAGLILRRVAQLRVPGRRAAASESWNRPWSEAR
ncbi:MAG: hypothetical protein JO352_16915 [Chloroflexi bacterium]|nr:hypothetical protein [Chloroflexota bacterium]MBV9601695.1 hypothetical protein [Chloroflexota bacterium]